MSEKYIRIDNTDKYALIGEYVVVFELIVFQIRLSLSVLFQLQGLKTWKMSEIVFGQKQFTAEPLVSCFESIANELLKPIKEKNINKSFEITPEELSNLISSFRKKFSNQISVRNDLLHGTYLIPDLHQGEELNDKILEDLHVFKDSPDKKGARRKIVSETKQDIIKHINELNDIYEQFLKLKINLFKLVNEHYN